MDSEEEASYYEDESELGSEEYDEEDDEYYDDYEEDGEYYEYEEQGEYEEIDYDEEWDDNVDYEEFPDVAVPKPTAFKVEEPPSVLIEDDPTDPRTWNEARQVFEESDSEDEDNHEEALREMMEAKIMENRKAILSDPFNILKAKQIVERLNLYKRKKLQSYKDELAKKPSSDETLDVTSKEKEIEQFIEKVFSPAGADFDALEYIAAIHGEASFDQLKTGAMFLNANIQQNTIQLKQFVQKNIQRYVTCKDTIDVIGEEIQHNELSNNRGTGKLIASHQEILSTAKSTYGPLYKRKKEAEHLRRTLQLLERYKFLLNLPASMKQSMDNGDYEQVLRDYQQSKELRENKELSVFAPIMKQVDSLIEEFEKNLLRSLEDSSLSMGHHRKTMKLLTKFGYSEDPFWHFLSFRQGSITATLQEAALPSSSNMTISLTMVMSGISAQDMGSLSILNQIKRTCEALSSVLPDFYWHCVQYQEELPQKRAKEPRDPFALLQNVLNTFMNITREILTDSAPSRRRVKIKSKKSKKKIHIREEITDPQDCLLCLLVCYKNCASIKGIQKHLEAMHSYIEGITEGFFEQAIQTMVFRIKSLKCIDHSSEQSLLMPECVLKSVEDIIYDSVNEWTEVFSFIEPKRQENNERFVEEGMQCFLEVLEWLQSQFKAGEDPLAYEEALLILLQSARESRISVFPRIIQTLCGCSQKQIKDLKKFVEKAKQLEDKFEEAYCSSKAVSLELLSNDTTWNSSEPVEDIGEFAKSVLLELVMVHAQIFGFVPDMVKPILRRLIDHTFDTLQKFCVSQTEQIHYNHKLAHQILVDILFIADVLKGYFTKKTKNTLNELANLLEKGKLADKEQVLQIIKLANIKTRVLFQCFED